MRKATRTIMAAFAAAALAVSLGACSAQPGVAARVGDQVWTEKDIDAGIAQFQEMTGQDISRQGVVWSLVNSYPIYRVLEEENLLPSESEIRATLEEDLQQGAIKSVPDTINPVIATLLRANSVKELEEHAKLTPEQAQQVHQRIAQVQATTKTEVNPRYGSVDPTAQALLPPVFGDVVAVPSS
ncbi:MAG: hypothetical protein Q4C87_03015 [Actinomycetaceae bacterium]|nr:hypothetical protein [Actinomycetaceae bacterium]